MHVTVQLPELLQISKDEGGYMQKLKLMIVDDEYLIRQYIRNCIDWERLGYTIVGELGTAQGALQLAEELKPDVVLTDICARFRRSVFYRAVKRELSQCKSDRRYRT